MPVDLSTWPERSASTEIELQLSFSHPYAPPPNYQCARNTIRNSWHTIGRRTIQSRVRQNSVQRMHRALDRRWRSLDRPNRRMGIIFSFPKRQRFWPIVRVSDHNRWDCERMHAKQWRRLRVHLKGPRADRLDQYCVFVDSNICMSVNRWNRPLWRLCGGFL